MKTFLDLADFIATTDHPEISTVGAVITDGFDEILSVGKSSIPEGVEKTPERRNKPGKFLYVEHAERDAIYRAAKNGVSLNQATLYSTRFPCADCARAIVLSGISKVVTRYINPEKKRWLESCLAGIEILEEALVEIEYVD